MQLPDYRAAQVLVVGDLMLDRYWHGHTSRISPEAPVPVVRISEAEERIGGAGNVALNCAALGATATLIGVTGDDEAAHRLEQLLTASGVTARLLRDPLKPTTTKLRVLSRHQQLIRLDFEDAALSPSAAAMYAEFSAALADADVVVLSDYGKGALVHAAELITLARAAGKPVLVDPKGADYHKYRDADLLTPNQGEFDVVAGVALDESDFHRRAGRLREALRLGALLVTQGEHGMTLFDRETAPMQLPAHAREVYDVTGAGDTVIAALAASLAAGTTLIEATILANLAASVVVGKLGAASVSAVELGHALHALKPARRGVLGVPELLEQVAAARGRGEKIVVTNGCFDLLHAGHVAYLQQAKALGDRLIVLVNSDASVRRLKGAARPLNPVESRMVVLAALECVDWVAVFDADTPRDWIAAIGPDLLVKGGDYQRIEDIAGYEQVLAQGGEVRILDCVAGISTTGLIQAMQNS